MIFLAAKVLKGYWSVVATVVAMHAADTVDLITKLGDKICQWVLTPTLPATQNSTTIM
jgi:hypothetical protein